MKKLLTPILICSLTMNACRNGKKNEMLEQSNCKITTGTIEDITKSYKNFTTSNDLNQKKMQLQFFNNPYQIDSSYNLSLIIFGGVAYQGKFARNVNLKMPSAINNKPCEIKFILEKEEQVYSFNTMQVGIVDTLDNFIQIVFIPKENDWFTFYFSFSQNDKYQEAP